MRNIQICMECREAVEGSKYVVVRESEDENLYYHEKCMPPEVRAQFEKPRASRFHDGPMPI